MTQSNTYQIGEPVTDNEGFLLGQYLEDETAFIYSNPTFLKAAFKEMGNHAIATHKETMYIKKIYCKRKIYNKEMGSKEQYLVLIADDLIWQEISEDEFEISDVEH